MSQNVFKQFNVDVIRHEAATRSSDQRQIRNELKYQYPMLEPHWSDMLGPTGNLRRREGIEASVLTRDDTHEIIFFKLREARSVWVPHLRLLHRYPLALAKHTLDKGGCRFILNGASAMCQGFTSAGGSIGEDVPSGVAVGIYVEGLDHAAAVGITTMNSNDIAKVNKGVCILNQHHLGDGLWVNHCIEKDGG